MLYGRSNNTKQEVNLNTPFYTSYSETAQVLAGGWNNQLSVKIKPCVGQDANGVRQYAEDRSQIVSTSITPENAITLVEGFESEVLPAIRGEKTKGSASIVMGAIDQRKILTVGYEDGNAYLAIALSLNENGTAGSEIRHIFNKKDYLVDYDPTVGNATVKSVEADLINFMDKVRAVKDLAPVTAHAIKYNDMNRSSFAPNNGGNAGNTYQQNTQTQSAYQAPMSNATSMEDFLPFS